MSDPVELSHAELYKGEDGDWWFRTISTNGKEIMRSSEGYGNKTDAVDALAGSVHPDLEIRTVED